MQARKSEVQSRERLMVEPSSQLRAIFLGVDQSKLPVSCGREEDQVPAAAALWRG